MPTLPSRPPTCRWNFQEFVRVSVNGKPLEGDGLKGSRASGKFLWYSQIQAERKWMLSSKSMFGRERIITTRLELAMIIHSLISALLTLGIDDEPAREPQRPLDPWPVVAKGRELAQKQEALAYDLNLIASDESRDLSVRQHALEVLGKIHSGMAIEGLVKNLAVPAVLSDAHALSDYPAAYPLITFGSAAYPEIWSQLTKPQSEKYLFILAHVVFRIDGKSIALLRLRNQLTAPRVTAVEKANLEKLLNILETVDLQHPKNRP